MSKVAAPPSQSELEARKALGKARLQENRIEDALRIYASILKDYPQDIDSCLFIGDCYLAEGDNETALLMYNQALSIDANHPTIQARLRLAKGAANQAERLGSQDGAIQSQEVARLLQRLAGRSTPVSEAEVQRAARLLEEMIHQPQPARAVAAHLNEIDELLPALLEVNIRQARADGRPDVAQALEALRDNILLQLNVLPAAIGASGDLASGAAINSETAEPRVLFLTGQPGVAPSLRQADPAHALGELGFNAELAEYMPHDKLMNYHCVIFRSPHRDARLLEALAFCSAVKVPIILDLDRDYEHMPIEHAEYSVAGLGALERSKAYTTALLLADRVSVPSEALGASLRSRGYSVQVIPDGWSEQNPLWLKPSPARRTLQIGWMGGSGQVEDVMSIRRVLIRLCREFPQVRLAIAGDPQVYQLFDNIPDASRLFLPAVAGEDYPYLFSQMDILVAPLCNNPFNQALPDRWLMETGVRGIPWVASPIPAFLAWRDGGLIANSLDEWHSNLRQLIMDNHLRESLGKMGQQKAQEREASVLAKYWADLIASVLPKT